MNKHTYTLLASALRKAGTYDPNKVMPYIEELLTPKDATTLNKFLAWCHINKKVFGSATYQERLKEWKRERTFLFGE